MKTHIKELIIFSIIIFGGVLSIVAASEYANNRYDEGRQYENTRLMDCYMDKDFSGFAWIDDSKYFVCSSEIRKGAVIYNNGK